MAGDQSQFRRSRRRISFLPLLLGVLVLVVLLLVPLSSLLTVARMPMLRPMGMPMPWAQQQEQLPLLSSLERQSPLWQRGLVIRTGIHVENIYDLSLKDKTYSADGRFWLEWPQPVQELIERDALQPVQLVDFVNQVDDWEGDIVADNTRPVRRGDHWFQSYHFSKQFYLHTLNLHRYPFNELTLPLTLQVNPLHAGLASRPLLLEPIHNQPGIIGEYASLDGYQLRRAEITPQLRSYRTDFGLGHVVRVSQVAVQLHYSPSFWPAFIAFLLPLIIILVMVLISPYLEGSLGDVRIAIPSTALLTLVFLQQGYNSTLPPSPYLTYLDRLYAVSYLICLALFVLFAWTSNVYQRTPDEYRQAVVRQLDVYDRHFQFVALAMLLVVSLEAWLY
jgi:hypothetical protein